VLGADRLHLLVGDGGERDLAATSAAAIAASGPFMSTAPRPRSQPSTTSPENPKPAPPALSGTVSVWPQRISRRPGRGPATVQSRFGRPGAASSMRGASPRDSSQRLNARATASSWRSTPGWLGMRTRSAASATAAAPSTRASAAEIGSRGAMGCPAV